MPTAKSAPRERAAAPAARPLLERALRLPPLGEAFVSEQHFGRPGTSLLRMSEPTREAYVASAKVPPGGELALTWSPISASTEEIWVLWMSKGEAGFRYALERPDGATGTPDELGLCARCHAEAPSDELFRALPEAPRVAPPAK